MATGYGPNRNMGRNKMTVNFSMSMDTNTLYHIRLEIMHRRYVRYKQQGIEKHYPLGTNIDRKSWLLVMGLAETSSIA